MKDEEIDYKEEIVAKLSEITAEWIIKQIYRCIINITKEG